MLTIRRPHIPDSQKFREYAARWHSPLWSKSLYRLIGPMYWNRSTQKEVNDFDFTTLEGAIVSTNGKKRINWCRHLKYDGVFTVSANPAKTGFRGFFTENGVRSYEGSWNWNKYVISESSDSSAEQDDITYNNNQNKQWTKYRSTRGTCTRETVNVFNQIHHAPDLSYSWWSTEGSGKTVIHDEFVRAEITRPDYMRVWYNRTTTTFNAANERRTSASGFPQYSQGKTTRRLLYDDVLVVQTLDLQGLESFWDILTVKILIALFGASLISSLPKYDDTIAVEAYDAVCKQLSSNNIENAVQLRDTISSVWKLPISLIRSAKAFAKVWTSMKRPNFNSIMDLATIAGKAASELHLWWRYVFKPTKSDFLELLEYSKKAIKRTRCLNGQWTRTRSSGSRVIYPDGQTAVTAKRNFSCYLRSSYPGGTPLAKMRGYGVDLGLANMWDLVPFSFVVDWFVEVGPWLSTIDAFYAYALFEYKSRCYSVKAECDLGSVVSLTQYGQGGSVKAYIRDPLWTVPLPTLPQLAQGKSYLLTSAALVVSNS